SHRADRGERALRQVSNRSLSVQLRCARRRYRGSGRVHHVVCQRRRPGGRQGRRLLSAAEEYEMSEFPPGVRSEPRSEAEWRGAGASGERSDGTPLRSVPDYKRRRRWAEWFIERAIFLVSLSA